MQRNSPVARVKVYSNCPSVELIVNGRRYVAYPQSDPHIFIAEAVPLGQADNSISAQATSGGRTVSDTCHWNLKS